MDVENSCWRGERASGLDSLPSIAQRKSSIFLLGDVYKDILLGFSPHR